MIYAVGIISFILGVSLTGIIAHRIGLKRQKKRYEYGLKLRNQLWTWQDSYRKRNPEWSKREDFSPEGRLLAAVYHVGTANIHRHDRW